MIANFSGRSCERNSVVNIGEFKQSEICNQFTRLEKFGFYVMDTLHRHTLHKQKKPQKN